MFELDPGTGEAEFFKRFPFHPDWLIGIPPLGCFPNILGSIIPELIINQQGFRSHCSHGVLPTAILGLEVEEELVAVSSGHSFCPPVGRCCQMPCHLSILKGEVKMQQAVSLEQ